MSHTLKVRDDHAPVCFEAAAENDGKLKLCEGSEASWLTQDHTFGIKDLRSRIERRTTRTCAASTRATLC